MDFAKAVARDFRSNLLDCSVRNSTRLRKRMTDEEFELYASENEYAIKTKSEIIETLNWLDDLIASKNPVHHTIDELKKYKSDYITLWENNLKL